MHASRTTTIVQLWLLATAYWTILHYVNPHTLTNLEYKCHHFDYTLFKRNLNINMPRIKLLKENKRMYCMRCLTHLNKELENCSWKTNKLNFFLKPHFQKAPLVDKWNGRWTRKLRSTPLATKI